MSCGNKSEVWITTARDLEKDLSPDFLIAYYILLNIAVFSIPVYRSRTSPISEWLHVETPMWRDLCFNYQSEK